MNDIDLEEMSKLFDTQDLFHLLSEISPAGIYLTDENGHCLYVNRKWSDMSGLSIEEARGDGWKRALHPSDAEDMFSKWQKVIDSNGKWLFEYRFVSKDAKITWVLGLAKPIYDNDSNLKGYLGINVDITERKRDAELRETLLAELQKALTEIKTLRGIIPICSVCKKIRDDEGSWQQIELYIRDHSDASFSHGLCPGCYAKEIDGIKNLRNSGSGAF